MNAGNINYYDPGEGPFFYARRCRAGGDCCVNQVAKSCNCKRAEDGQLHYISQTAEFIQGKAAPKSGMSVAPAAGKLPCSLSYNCSANENLESVSRKFNTPVALLQGANSDLKDKPTSQALTKPVSIPAQGYSAQGSDTLPMIATRLSIPIDVLSALNPEINNATVIGNGKLISIPMQQPDQPLVYRIQANDTLSSISQAHGVSIADLSAANADTGGLRAPIFVGELIRMPSRTPSQGKVNWQDSVAKSKRDGGRKEEVFVTTIEVGENLAAITAKLAPKRSR